MKPTIGRVVHYHPHPTQARYSGLPPHLNEFEEHAALVTFVHPQSGWVELAVFPPRGGQYTVSAVEGTSAGEWSWPPRA
ncbi:hypothetical protein CH273_13085 [Rhodococcus sp. 05-339-2]|uniref:hypothetical protein n=1 Tax=Rhodococcoides fascians TaxID=1828 RepID=UPI00050C174D|nr:MULTISPECIES: hypothetical protein [Rhodococcus]OZD81605.1 hypothetical protein CH273_13085 [Rhodococcus sp. 05-339-2]